MPLLWRLYPSQFHRLPDHPRGQTGTATLDRDADPACGIFNKAITHRSQNCLEGPRNHDTARGFAFGEGNSAISLLRFCRACSRQRANRVLQILESESQIRMPGREPLLQNRNGVPKQRNRFSKAPRTIHHVAKVVARKSRIRRLRAQAHLLNGKCAPVMFFGLLVMAAGGQKRRQIVQIGGDLIMLRPVSLLEGSQCPPVNLLALDVLFQAIEDGCVGYRVKDGLRIVFTQQAARNVPGFPCGLLRSGKISLRVQNAADVVIYDGGGDRFLDRKSVV